MKEQDVAMAYLRAHAINEIPVALKYNLDNRFASTEVFLRYHRYKAGLPPPDLRSPSIAPHEAEIVRGGENREDMGVGLWVGILIKDFETRETHADFSPKLTNMENLIHSGRQVFQRVQLGDSKFMRVVAVLRSPTSKSPSMNFMFLASPGRDGICQGYHRFYAENSNIFLFSRYRDDTVARGAAATKKASKDLIMKALLDNKPLSSIPSSVWGAIGAGREAKRRKVTKHQGADNTASQAVDGDETEIEHPGPSTTTSKAVDGDETEIEHRGPSTATSKALDADETEVETSELECVVVEKDDDYYRGASILRNTDDDDDDDVVVAKPSVAKPGPSTMVSSQASNPHDSTALLRIINNRAIEPPFELIKDAWTNFLVSYILSLSLPLCLSLSHTHRILAAEAANKISRSNIVTCVAWPSPPLRFLIW